MISSTQTMTRRQKLDRERYMRHREARLERQRAYYQEHREDILRKKKNGIIR